MTASPTVLTSRTGGSAMSVASSAKRSASAPSSEASTLSPRRVKPIRSANATVRSAAPGSRPLARSLSPTATCRSTALR